MACYMSHLDELHLKGKSTMMHLACQMESSAHEKMWPEPSLCLL